MKHSQNRMRGIEIQFYRICSVDLRLVNLSCRRKSIHNNTFSIKVVVQVSANQTTVNYYMLENKNRFLNKFYMYFLSISLH